MFSCDHGPCSASFFSKQELREHRMQHDKRDFECDQCGAAFKERNALNKHQRIHNEFLAFACPQCEKKFTHKSNLARHLKIHEGSKEYGCTFCGKRFASRSNLTQHLLVHKPNEEVQQYACNLSDCKKTYRYFASLKKHTRKYHPKHYATMYKKIGSEGLQKLALGQQKQGNEEENEVCLSDYSPYE